MTLIGDDLNVTVKVKRVVLWLVVVLAVVYLVRSPGPAAAAARDAGQGLAALGASMVSFVASLF